MAKSFLERMADKDRELTTIRQAVQTEIKSAEERLTAIDAEKTTALKNQNRDQFVALCAERDSVVEYIESNKKYLAGLTSKAPFTEVYSAWQDRQKEFDETVRKQSAKLTKLESDLLDVFRTLEAGRQVLNMEREYYQNYVDPATYPAGHSADSFGIKAVNDIPSLRELYNYLQTRGLISVNGERIR